MRPEQYTITPQDVEECASAVLQDAIGLKDRGRKCRAQVLWHILLYAAARITSIFDACQRLTHAPSDDAVRQALVAGLPPIDELEKRLNEGLRACLPQRWLSKTRRWRLGCDLTLIPYHGEPRHDANEVYRGEAKSGTTHFHAYATMYVVHHGRRYTLALTRVLLGTPMPEVLRCLLKRVRAAGGLLPRRSEREARGPEGEIGASASPPPGAEPAVTTRDLTLRRGGICHKCVKRFVPLWMKQITGYDQLLEQFQQLHERWSAVHFHIRIDAAGQYAANLEAFLRALPFAKTLTVGEPTRNQNYRKALFPKRKADPVESLCAARFALLEKPTATPATADACSQLREIVQRLEGQSRQSTRLTNQLHNLLARVFPELALLVTDLQARWVLRLLAKHPTPAQLVRVSLAKLTAIPFLTERKAQAIQAAATTTVASLSGDAAGALVQQLVRQLRDSLTAEDKLHALMVASYRQLPQPNHLDSIPGIGVATAAVLTAKMVSADRFPTPAHLVSYFGIFPEQDASGIDKDGLAKPGRRTHMSRKGNDLVRKYLWNAAKAAIRCNPAVRPLYRRLRARGARGDVALGHCMRKLLQLALAIWRTAKPFDPENYPWQTSNDANKKNRKPQPGHEPESISGHCGLLQRTASRRRRQVGAASAGGAIASDTDRQYRLCGLAPSGQHGTSPGPSRLSEPVARRRRPAPRALPHPRPQESPQSLILGPPRQKDLPVLSSTVRCPRQRLGPVGGGSSPASLRSRTPPECYIPPAGFCSKGTGRGTRKRKP